MQMPSALCPGDTIGIAAPASPFDRKKFTRGIHALERLGFKAHYGHDIFDQNRYLAGTDERRAQEFCDLISNREVKAVMFARGGYGSQRIIPLLDVDFLKKHIKPVIGFSDVTALLAFLRQSADIPTFYGPAITQLGKSTDGFTAEMFQKAITTQGAMGPANMQDAITLKTGVAKGKIVGGCLSLINSSMGTAYELDTNDSILFIEEVNEKVYVLDRMLTQLKNSNKLKGTRGIVFGSLIPPPDEPHDVKSMILDVLGDFDGPIVANYPAGHIERFATLPLGVDVELDASNEENPKLNFSSGLLS